MDYRKMMEDLMERLPEGYIFNRQELLEIAGKINPEFKETLLRNLLGKLLEDERVARVGRNHYQKNSKKEGKKIYQNQYSREAQRVVEIMEEKYPLLDYRVWELNWLNEFWNHQVAQNKIWVEVERMGCDFVYTELHEEYSGNILLRPNEKELYRYGGKDTVIIDRLVSEAPKGKPNSYNTPLEKVIVDLFANKNLKGMLHIGEYGKAISEMFDRYYIDQTKLFRYASRRKKREEVYRFLAKEVGVRLTKEG